MEDRVSVILLGVAIVVLLGLNIGLQVLRTRRAPLGRVVNILSSVRYNEKWCENFNFKRNLGRLKVSAWEKNRDKVTFLPGELMDELSRLFEKIAEVNVSVDAALRFKSDSYMSAVSVDSLREAIVPVRERLQRWIKTNMQNPEYLPKKRSLFRR